MKKNDFFDEMKHYEFILKNIPISLDEVYSYSRWFVLFCIALINIFILFDTFEEDCEECTYE